jgi:membrane protein required for colicin V production
MATLDWIFLGVLVASLLLGAWRGLVYEVLSVVNWIAAFVLAQWLAPLAAGWLPFGEPGDSLRKVVAFLLVFVVAAFVGGWVAGAVRRWIQAGGMRPVDRTLGGAFGFVRGMLLMLAAAVVVNMTALKAQDWWMESVGAGVATTALKGLKPVLPQTLGAYLPG